MLARLRTLGLLVLGMWLALPYNASAQAYPDLNLTHRVGGGVSSLDVDFERNRAYMATGLRLQIIDISDLGNPLSIATSNTIHDRIEDIAVEESFLYAIGTHFHIFDISDDTFDHVGLLPNINGRQVIIQDGIAFVASDTLGFTTINVDNPTQPTHLYAKERYVARDIALAGTYAFTNSSGAIDRYNISNPEELVREETFDPIRIGSSSGFVSKVAVEGKLLAASVRYNSNENIVLIFDITDVTQLKIVREIEVEGHTLDLEMNNGLLSIAGYNGIEIHDLVGQNFQSPKLMFAHEGNNTATILPEQPREPLFLLDEDLGFIAIDLQDGNPVGTFATMGTTWSCRQTEDGLVAVGANSGIWLLDEDTFAVTGWQQTANQVRIVRTKDNVVYGVGKYHNVIDIVDARDPANVRHKQFQLGDKTTYIVGLEISEDMLVVAPRYGNTVLVDISDSMNPMITGTLPTSTISGITASEDYIFVAGYWDVKIFDISNPSQARLVSTIAMHFADRPDAITALQVIGEQLIIASDGSLHIVDIGDIDQPVLVDERRGHYGPNDFELDPEGDLLYFAHGIWVSILSPHTLRSYRSPQYVLSNHFRTISLCRVNGNLAVNSGDGIYTSPPSRWKLFLPFATH